MARAKSQNSSNELTLVDPTEAVSRLGISAANLRWAVKNGKVTTLPDGNFYYERLRWEFIQNVTHPKYREVVARLRLEMVADGEAAIEADTSLYNPNEKTPYQRKEYAVARLKEIELAREEGQLIEFEEVKQQWEVIAKRLQNSILSIPDRLSLRLANRSATEIRSVLTKELRQMLLVLTSTEGYQIEKGK